MYAELGKKGRIGMRGLQFMRNMFITRELRQTEFRQGVKGINGQQEVLGVAYMDDGGVAGIGT